MTTNTPLVNESSTLMKTFETVVNKNATSTETSSTTRCKVYTFEHFVDSETLIPENHTSVADMVSEFESNDKRRAAIQDARRWVADAFHNEDGETVRTMRLKKGWSQSRLAQELSTSQPHIVRIERGTENLSIGTCRKLCEALDIDMNGLDQALKRQSDIAEAKHK